MPFFPTLFSWLDRRKQSTPTKWKMYSIQNFTTKAIARIEEMASSFFPWTARKEWKWNVVTMHGQVQHMKNGWKWNVVKWKHACFLRNYLEDPAGKTLFVYKPKYRKRSTKMSHLTQSKETRWPYHFQSAKTKDKDGFGMCYVKPFIVVPLDFERACFGCGCGITKP